MQGCQRSRCIFPCERDVLRKAVGSSPCHQRDAHAHMAPRGRAQPRRSHPPPRPHAPVAGSLSAGPSLHTISGIARFMYQSRDASSRGVASPQEPCGERSSALETGIIGRRPERIAPEGTTGRVRDMYKYAARTVGGRTCPHGLRTLPLARVLVCTHSAHGPCRLHSAVSRPSLQPSAPCPPHSPPRPPQQQQQQQTHA